MGGGVNRGGGVVGASGAAAASWRLRGGGGWWWRRAVLLFGLGLRLGVAHRADAAPRTAHTRSPQDCAHTFTKAVWSLVCVRQDGRLLQWPQVSHRVTGLRCATAGLRMRSMRSCNAQFPNQMLLLVPYMPLASFSVPKKAAQMLPSAI